MTKLFEKRLARKIENPPAGIALRFVQTPEEFISALRFVYEIYKNQGYIPQNSEKIHLNEHLILNETSTLIATHDKKIVGTVSFIPDSASIKLPADVLFGETVDRIRAIKPSAINTEELDNSFHKFYDPRKNIPESTIEEIGALALDPEIQSKTNLVYTIMNLVYKRHCLRGAGYYLAETEKRHAPIYKKMWHFEELASGERFSYDKKSATLLGWNNQNYADFKKASSEIKGLENLVKLRDWEGETLSSEREGDLRNIKAQLGKYLNSQIIYS